MRKILFSTDLSTHSNNALKYAIELSKKTNSQLIIFHSSYIPESVQKEEYDKIVKETTIYRREAVIIKTNDYCTKHNISVPKNVIYEVKNEKSIIKNILNAAQKHDVDLIVVGTHGITALKKVLFGSVTSELIASSPIPVLAIPQGFNYTDIDTIVYASDFKKFKKEIVKLKTFADVFDADMEVLYLDYWETGNSKEAEFNKVIESNKYNNIKFVEHPVKFDKTMQEHLMSYMKNKDGSILLMFHEDRNFFDKLLFQSNTEKLAFNLHKPILSIKK